MSEPAAPKPGVHVSDTHGMHHIFDDASFHSEDGALYIRSGGSVAAIFSPGNWIFVRTK